MLTVAEIATAIGAVAGVVGISVAATVYMSGDGNELADNNISPVANSSQRYVISDAYYQCRDHLDNAVKQQVRNVHVDSHSSRYDSGRNDNVVFINMEVMERVGESLGAAESAQVVCRVSAVDNEIKSFQVNKG